MKKIQSHFLFIFSILFWVACGLEEINPISDEGNTQLPNVCIVTSFSSVIPKNSTNSNSEFMLGTDFLQLENENYIVYGFLDEPDEKPFIQLVGKDGGMLGASLAWDIKINGEKYIAGHTYSISQISEEEIVLLGRIKKDNMAHPWNTYVAKFDIVNFLPLEQSQRCYGTENNVSEFLREMVITNDGKLLLAGNTNSTRGEVFVFKLFDDPQLNRELQSFVPNNGSTTIDYNLGINKAHEEGEYLLTGYRHTPVENSSNQDNRAWVTRIDQDLKHISENDFELNSSAGHDSFYKGLLNTNGYTFVGVSGGTLQNFYNFQKIDSNNKNGLDNRAIIALTDKNLMSNDNLPLKPFPNRPSIAKSIAPSHNGSNRVVIAGTLLNENQNRDIFLLEFDTINDSIIWKETYNLGLHEIFYEVIQTKDGGYALLGNQSIDVSDTVVQPFLLKTDCNGKI